MYKVTLNREESSDLLESMMDFVCDTTSSCLDCVFNYGKYKMAYNSEKNSNLSCCEIMINYFNEEDIIAAINSMPGYSIKKVK